jgi:hypothetical protein
MVDTRVIVVCAVCGVHWYELGEAAQCTDATHEQVRVDVHRHRDRVVLPDGTAVFAASFDALDLNSCADPPDYGLYLDDRWQPPWPHDHVEWPDFGVPADASGLLTALRSLHDRSRAGERVEIGCLGGHGRTGTSLACLAVLAGAPASDAIAWVRSAYCADAVETPEQEAFVSGVSTSIGS